MRRRRNYGRRHSGRRTSIWTGNFLKMIAVIAMMADHIAVAVLEQGMLEACAGDAVIFQQFMASEEGRTFYMIDRGLRAFGRVSFPIICFLLTQGFFYSRNRKNYVVRLVLAALISEPFFDIAIFGSWFYIQYQNVLFTYAAALLVLMGMEQYRRQPMVQILCILAGCGVTWLIQSDFWVIGILLPVIFYWFRNEPLFMAIGGGILSAVDSAYFYGSAVLAYIPILLYNGKRGNWHIKYFFYVFYPLQFLLLYLVRLWLAHGQWFAGFLEKSIR